MKNIIKYLLLLIALVVFFMISGCKEEPQADPDDGDEVILTQQITADYFPTTIGLYKRFNDSSGGWEETINQSTEFNGQDIIPVEHHRLGAPIGEQKEELQLMDYTNFYVTNEEAVLLVGVESELASGETFRDTIDPPWHLLRFGMQQNNEWAYEMLNPPGMVKVKVAGFEDMNTPAGSFRNVVRLKLDYEYINEGGELEQSSRFEWYAPGVGLVKIKSENNHEDAELIEFKQKGN